jgi:uncharacterized protein
MKRSGAIWFFLLAASGAAAGIESREVSFASGSHRLPGVLTTPAAAEPFASVLVIPGSGPLDRDGRSRLAASLPPTYRVWAERLSEAGLAVLRYDKRSIAYPGLDVPSLDQEDQIADALSAVAFLRALPQRAAQRIYVLGHSEGGTLAPLVAARDGGVAGVAVVNTVQFPVDELVLAQFEARPELAKTREEVKRLFADIARGTFPERGLLLGAGARYWSQWIRYSGESPAALLRLPLPVLLVQCLADESLPGPTLARNVAELRSIAEGSVELRELPGLNHFGMASGAAEPSRELSDVLIQWLKSREKTP